MIYLRPIRESDIDQLEKLSEEAGVGLTTLPKNRKKLEEKIHKSLESFAATTETAGDESYLFVLADQISSAILGTCGIVASVGTNTPFYSYKLGTLVHSSEALGIYKEVQLLYLANDYRNVTEICTLYLTPKYRKTTNGRLLSRSRFLFMAIFPERFSSHVIAEMRGVQDEEGRSPFWRNLGKHFFDMDFSKADYLNAIGNKQFVADLMPKYPIYVPLLPEAAREVIGQVHVNTVPALKFLEREGFRKSGYVDIFDAGPTVEASLSEIATVRESQTYRIDSITPIKNTELTMVSNTSINFRVCVGSLNLKEDGTAHLSQEMAKILDVKPEDTIRCAPF